MLAYPITLPHPIVSGNSAIGGETFTRSNFDYAPRQRADKCSAYIFKRNFFLESEEVMRAFKDFYYTGLSNGAKPFTADWIMEGFSGTKEFRFTKRYSSKQTSKGLYEISCDFEMLTKLHES